MCGWQDKLANYCKVLMQTRTASNTQEYKHSHTCTDAYIHMHVHKHTQAKRTNQVYVGNICFYVNIYII